MMTAYALPRAAADDDEVLRDLDALVQVLDDGASLAHATLTRAHELREWRLEGRSYTEILAAEPRPLVVEMISDYLSRVGTAGSRFRHSQARALRAEGMTTQAIADLFGVTRQRISAILNDGDRPGSAH
jgi:CRP-like cAMP-binding protein